MIDTLWTLKQIFGTLLIFTSIFDAIKYTVQALKIHRERKARMSRRFINWAIMNDVVKLIYGMIILDIYIVLSSILALICMTHLWYEIYMWYPYRMRGCTNFKRPNIMLYLINSLLPNRIRKRL
jgi:lipid-A-disaccharide synthase-like uncharacterized protein